MSSADAQEARANELRVAASQRAKARRAFGGMLQDALLDPGLHSPVTLKTLDYLTPAQVEYVVRTGLLPRGFEFHHLMTISDFPEFGHLGEVGVGLPKDVHRQAAHGGETSRPVETPSFIDPAAETRGPFHLDPEGQDFLNQGRGRSYRPRDFEIAEGSRTSGDVDVDLQVSARGTRDRMQQQVDRLAENLPRMETRAQNIEARLTQLETELAAARKSGKPVDGIQDQIARRQETLAEVRGRIASIPNLRAQIAVIDHFLVAGPHLPPAPPGPSSPSSPPPPSSAPDLPPTPKTPPPPAASSVSHPSPGDAAPALAPPRQVVEGFAAAIRESDFRGDAVPPGSNGAVHAGHLDRALGSFLNSDTAVAKFVDHDATDSNQFLLQARNGDLVDVKVTIAPEPLPPGPDGISPAARILHDEHTGEYHVEVSPGTAARHLERVLAHEFTEIRARHRRTERADVLTPGGQPAKVPPGEISPLSPHDEGRMAELAVVAKLLKEDISLAKRMQLRDDAERLVAELGLVGASQAAEARRGAARGFSELSKDGLDLLNHAIAAAPLNPALISMTGNMVPDLKTLQDGLARIAALETAEALEFSQNQARAQAASPDQADRAQARARNSRQDALQAIEKQRAMLQDVAAQALIDARLVAKIRTRPAGTRLSDLVSLLGIPIADWLTGTPRAKEPFVKFITDAAKHAAKALDSGMMQRSETRKVEPGFEADFIDAAGRSVPKSRAMPADSNLVPTGTEVHLRVADRKALIEERALPTTSPNRVAEIEAAIILHSEKLGEAAGREFARQHLGLSAANELTIPRSGAGVPDLMFDGPGGRLVIVECKGGTSPLGVRESADGRYLVQQGTIEYLQSLARTMENSSNELIRDRGERLKTELAKNPPNVDYYVVRQPFTADNSLAPPEVGRFDLTPNQPRQPNR